MRFYLAPKNRVLPLVSVAAIVVLALIGLGSPSAQSRIIDSASPADRDWCAEATSLAFPKTPASGKLRGQAFTVETAAILGKKLMLRQGKDFFANHEIEIYFRTEDLEGKSFSVSPTDDMFHSFNIISSLCSPGQTAPSMDTINKGYGLRIQFGKRQGNLLPG